MIVSGPDIAQAQLIAKQLSSGAARLATLNGKQVLISTTPKVINLQQQSTVKTEIPKNVKLPSEPLPLTAINKDELVKPQPILEKVFKVVFLNALHKMNIEVF